MTLDAMTVPPAHEAIVSLHLSSASSHNSRRFDINYEYLLHSAVTGGWRKEQHFPPFNGDNDEHQVQSTAWTDSWVEKGRKSLRNATWLYADGSSNIEALVL